MADERSEPWVYAGITVSGDVEALLLGELPSGVNYGISHQIGCDEWWDWRGGHIPGDHWQPHPDPEDLWRRACIARLNGQITRLLQ